MPDLFILIVGGLIALFVIFVLIYKSFYKKAPADAALVISGGSKKRVVFGGTLVNPITNVTQIISLNTLQLPVEREGQAALITKDSLRVDIQAEFYVKIEPNEADVLKAVASLGDKTLTPQAVNSLLEGKLVGVLRSVAATMDLQELHEKRQEFSDQVQEACLEDLEQNGFKLETVAVTNLDQTPLESLDENNRFDVVAIMTIKKEVEEKQTETAKIEHENKVRREEDRLLAELEIKQKEEETETKALEVEQRLEFAQEEQRKEIATNKAEQERAVEAHKFEQLQAVEEARIKQEQAVKSAEIVQTQKIEMERIEQEKMVEESEIAQKQAVEIARVQQQQTVEEAEIQRTLTIEKAKIDQEATVKETDIERKIILLDKERAEKEAEAENTILVSIKEKEREAALIEFLEVSAEKARAEAAVETAEAIEKAERESKVELIRAEQEADEERIAKEKTADAEVYTIVETAKAELEAAQVKAEATKILSEALLVEARAEADGEEALITAKNQAEPQVLVSDAVLALVEALPEVTNELMKPAERIESIRVLDLGGNGGGNGSSGSMNRILGSIINAGAAMPLLKELVNFSGIDTAKIGQTISDYAKGLNRNAVSDSESDSSSEPESEPVSD
ncbi:MAG: SPFH domain-containing protein [Candidatus Poribacteria bacterium]|nr:SPFH domain-containing protein [Candidatus Poribacteria bacterium]